MDLGYNQFGYDDSRGLRKKKGPMAKVMRLMRFANKGSWLLVLLLLGFVWHLHSHKKTLRSDLETHKDEKEGLMQQLNLLDTSVTQKTKEAEEYQRLHSQVASMANQHQSNLQKTQEELAHLQLVYDQCKRDVEEELARSAARKCEDCGPLKTQVDVEKSQNTHLQAEITHLKTQLSAVTAQLEQLKQGTIPKPVDTSQQQAAGGGGTTQERTTHDDHIDAAIAGHNGQQQAVPTPIVDPNQQQQQQQQLPVPVQQQRKWGRGGRVPVPVDAPVPVHPDEHDEPVMTPDERKLKRRGGGRRKGGLSMLEEHLGVEHDDAEEINY